MSLADVQRKIGDADVTLIAVSKQQPLEKIQAVLDAGQRVFGENRVQDAQDRWLPLKEKYPDVVLHLIGSLQTNKAKDAVALFDVIHTVDREKLATELGAEMKKQNRPLPCFIQVNTGEEEQKGGVLPQDLEKLFHFATTTAGLNIVGLMCIPPENELPDMHFALLHKMAHKLGIPSLSMGMSGDFEIAIRYGATHIRVGSALFGSRLTA